MLLWNAKTGWILITLALAFGCKPARYEIVANTKGGDPIETIADPAPNQNDDKTDPPFRIEGPATGKVGETIKVIGIDCGPNNTGKITFIALGTTEGPKNGPTADFKFDRANTYTIEGTCEVEGKAPQKATISIKIDDITAAPGGQNGGQNGQNQSGQSGQNP